jgi:hypothetical protein
MGFEQAQILVQKGEQFERLRAAIERAFAEGTVEKVLKRFQQSGVRIREFEKALDSCIFEAVDPALAQVGASVKQLYAELTLSDQALMREFYLERVEQVDANIRRRFSKTYQYY